MFDNTLYAGDKTLHRVLARLLRDSYRAIDWFRINSMVVNPGKFQMMILGDPSGQSHSIKLNDITIHSSNTVELLGITLTDKLNFNDHVTFLCKSAN